MTLLEAIIMGVVQGLTEFLPVSSSGHLVIFGKLLGAQIEGSVLFEIILHLGTLIAIAIAFYEDIAALILNGLAILKNTWVWVLHRVRRSKEMAPKIIETSYQRFVMLIIVATIPTVILALILENLILQAFSSLVFTGIGLLVTATLLLITMKLPSGNLDEQTVSYKKAILVGIFQGFATFPGVSRSGSTMVAGLLGGMKREFVVKFSFIMSIPAILGAMLLQVLDYESSVPLKELILPYGTGMAASALVGFICIKLLLQIVRKGKLHYFAYYCYFIGTLLLLTLIF